MGCVCVWEGREGGRSVGNFGWQEKTAESSHVSRQEKKARVLDLLGYPCLLSSLCCCCCCGRVGKATTSRQRRRDSRRRHHHKAGYGLALPAHHHHHTLKHTPNASHSQAAPSHPSPCPSNPIHPPHTGLVKQPHTLPRPPLHPTSPPPACLPAYNGHPRRCLPGGSRPAV